MIGRASWASERLITLAEAARIAKKKPQTIRRWLDRGLLTAFRRELDGRRLVDEDELRRKLRAEPEGGE